MKETNVRVFSKISGSIYYNKNEGKLLAKKYRNLERENVKYYSKITEVKYLWSW